MRLGSIALFLCIMLACGDAEASCRSVEPPSRSLTAQLGATTDTLTGNHSDWNEQYLILSTRAGPAHASYASVTADQRFGLSDVTYEAGTYFLLAPKLYADAIASFSPTHQVLPNSTLQGGLDLRLDRGYGIQAGFTQRNYPTAVAGILTTGADRYAGNDHVSITITAVHLSNVPGIAMSAGIAYARTLRCDDLYLAVSGGRDVENTGVGANVAIYQTINYTASVNHWLSPFTAIRLGAGWYLLTGAYDRFEVHLAINQRF
jgi:YaiO family outer membrane protein